LSRKMEFDDLISVLVEEHAKMKRDLEEVRLAVSRKDFPSASRILKGLDDLFKQHIADEEAQVLRLLIEAYGVEGSDDAIRVFRQHRPIYDLMMEVEKLASLPPEVLASDEERLRRLLDEHTWAEETRIFPKASETHKMTAYRA
jgi:hemerythrin-like domain-containing protein